MQRKASFLGWFSPRDLSRLTQLQMISRGVVEGLSGGIHRSRLIGASVDFKEHRPYVPGDEVRSIDWKLFGKTDRLYIRQFEDETNMRCVLIVDQSGSMKYQSETPNAVSKHDYAVRLAACFAYLLISQQDSAGVATFDTAIRNYIPPKSQPSHLQLITELLANSTPGGETDIGAVLQSMLPRLQKRGLAMILSDCLGDPQALVRSVALMKSQVRNVIVCQVLDDDEWDFPFQQRTMFRSLEKTDHSVVADPIALRKAYLEKLQKHQFVLTNGFRQYGVEFLSVRTSEDLGEVVGKFLSERTAKQSMGGA
ncbi:MAG: DUF58 domain-containing protein [Pirellula sp.]|jgi:uncharacterized protein (DUF58 family)|nr:DUF58 domain-containing protein [Pirellula sp.]